MKNVVLFIIVLLLAVDCRKSRINQSDQNSTEIFPNKVGDTWVYLVNDTSFTFQTPLTIVQYNMTISVIDSVQLAGGIKANVWVYNSPAGNDTNYVFKHGDTISFASNRAYYGNIVRQYIIPLKLHDSWEYSSNSVRHVTVDSQLNIIVGQNHFDNTFHILGNPGRPDEIIGLDEWVKDNVGVVRRYVNASGTTNPLKHLTSWSLISYHLE